MTLTTVPGIRVGHAHHNDTGCTVVLCPPDTVGGVDQRGGAPGTRETDLLRPMHMVQHVNAIMLAGGSAFGLAAADGVMRYLEEQGIGFETPAAKVPIVPGAILFDLDVARSRPDAAMGYAACQNDTNDPVMQGCVGAGAGAKVGAMLGVQFATKSGVGSVSIELGNGLIVAALMVVNAVGDVYDAQGNIIAGVRPDGRHFGSTLELMKQNASTSSGHTIIGVIATNARFDKDSTNKLAQMAHDGIAQAVRPAHMPFDGDTIFSLATGTHEANIALVGAFAAEVTAEAIRQAVLQAKTAAGIPAARDV
jgi:L-aminopeptidase/D-esterase-like protein